MSDEIGRLREELEASRPPAPLKHTDIHPRGAGHIALWCVWPELLAVVEAATRFDAHRDAPRAGLVADFAARRAEARADLTHRVRALRAAIREHLGGDDE